MSSDQVLGPGAKEIFDYETFSQLLEMDDDDTDREFSRSIVEKYYEQAENTMSEMAAALDENDLEKIGNLGHFLKGSTASLGLTKVRDTCEELQNVNSGDTGEDIALTLSRLRNEFNEARALLEQFYSSN